MRKLSVIIFIVSFFFPFCSLTGANSSIPDSLLTEKQVYAYTFSDTEKAKEIIQIMRKRKLGTEFSLDIVEGDLYSNNRQYKKALVFYSRALKSKSQENTAQENMQLLHRMISCYDGLHDEPQKAMYVKLLLEKAEEEGSKEMKSIALFEMGKMIYYQEDKDNAYELIREAIEVMKQSDYPKKFHNLRYNYNTLLTMLQRDGRYDEALEALDDLEAVVTESTNKTHTIAGLDDKEMKTLYAWRAVILSYLGKIKEADEAYENWEITGSDYKSDDYLITTYLIQRRKYDKVIEIYGARENFLKANNDTINYHMRSLQRILGKAYEGKGDYKRATEYYKDLAVLTDSLKVREQQSAAVELATVYQTNEKEVKLQEQRTHVKIRNILLLTAGLVILLLLALLIRQIRYARTIRYKNKRMVDTIDELLHQKDELLTVKKKLQSLGESQTDREVVKNKSAAAKLSSEEVVYSLNSNTISDEQVLFETLEQTVMRDQLYLNPYLSREDLMNIIQVNKNRFGQIIQEYAGTNTTTYINNKRLEYATRLLKKHADQKIASVAEECGIPNIPTFNRLFKAKFGMTPVEFRNSLKVS